MRVSIIESYPDYVIDKPFHPSDLYPEYPFQSSMLSARPNPNYEAVRNSLFNLGLDNENFGTPCWNPFGKFLHENSKIVIKPNFVNNENCLGNSVINSQALVTQASILRPIIDYVVIACRGKCVLTILDLPMQSADFNQIVADSGLSEVISFIESATNNQAYIRCNDIRRERIIISRTGAFLEKKSLIGDPLGYVSVNLGSTSCYVPIENDSILFRTPDYAGDATVKMHSPGRHEYIISKTALDSDLFINVPKLKVHKKVGVTISLKNLVGIVADKSCLPHYRSGRKENGGDEYIHPSSINRLRSLLSLKFRMLGKYPWQIIQPIGKFLLKINEIANNNDRLININSGDWFGNDTAWRMIHDLNKIILFADKEGVLKDTPQRYYLSIVDGIIGGEGEGPLSPQPVKTGLIVAGHDPLAVDICCTKLIGFDWNKIPQLNRYDPGMKYPFSNVSRDLSNLEIIYNDNKSAMKFSEIEPIKYYQPSLGWRDYIEIK
ncbi:MAG: DUF362 domain-containing protein [Anaerolineaceae bacterium]|nr:DUF362 domain-containing protein [Anaerolineaceae bacterium]